MCACFNKLFLINFFRGIFWLPYFFYMVKEWKVACTIRLNFWKPCLHGYTSQNIEIYLVTHIVHQESSLSAELINIWLSGSNISTLYRSFQKWGDSNVKVIGEK